MSYLGKTKYTGSGIGLVFCYRIIERMVVVSELSQGKYLELVKTRPTK